MCHATEKNERAIYLKKVHFMTVLERVLLNIKFVKGSNVVFGILRVFEVNLVSY